MKATQSQLTAAEMGKLWAAYIGNSMGKCVLSYYQRHVDNKEIKKIVQYALGLSEAYLKDIEVFFNKSNFPIPIGFTNDDVNLEAPRLFEDEFYLHYLQYVAKAGMSLYSVAIPLVTRKDLRDFFINCVDDTSKLMVLVNEATLSNNVLIHSPVIPPPRDVDFVKDQGFLNSFFGDVRPLHGLEIAHLYGNLNNDITSRALIVGFSQGARSEKIKDFLERGKNLNQKHIERMLDKLQKEDLPSPSHIDHLVTPSTVPPFSDKLMIFHKIDMFSMKVREYANAISVNGRKDIGSLVAKFLMDAVLYVEDGANIMISNGWLEQPPTAIDRDKLQ